MKGSRGSQRWSNKRVQFQEPSYKMPKSSFRVSSGTWKPSTNLWEKEYCESVGVSWDQVCDNNNELEGFEHILKWDDSGALEAFQMAKQRYWAHRHGHSSEIPLPSPDLYIQEIDWDYHPQAGTEVPERHHSSSPEECKKPYRRRGYRGRRRNFDRTSDKRYVKSNWTMHEHQANTNDARLRDKENNILVGEANRVSSAPKQCMDWQEHGTGWSETNRPETGQTGWEDLNGASWDARPVNQSDWEVQRTQGLNKSEWREGKDSGWDSQNVSTGNAFCNGNTWECCTSWGNQAEPMKESTITSGTGWTDTGNAAKNSFSWGGQNQNEINRPVESGWASYHANGHVSGRMHEKRTGWGSDLFHKDSSTYKNDSSNRHTGAALAPQDGYGVNQGWNQHWASARSHHKNYPLLPTQWNSATPTAQQWHSSYWAQGYAEPQHHYKGSWVDQPTHSFPRGIDPSYRQPSYQQTVWRPVNRNKGHWSTAPQYKEGYNVRYRHYTHRTERDYQSYYRRNRR
eukprot:TRINITY_DN31306_c0_g1_i1.p1 TRINITY_DN31306_c0_g1~~TRINITY_DN31306_c0_g1_i1.p1  ORF type:complete len:513 (+),score=80.50 TRINITY_DN31306_c0_g1_i1:325-1863(+)